MEGGFSARVVSYKEASATPKPNHNSSLGNHHYYLSSLSLLFCYGALVRTIGVILVYALFCYGGFFMKLGFPRDNDLTRKYSCNF